MASALRARSFPSLVGLTAAACPPPTARGAPPCLRICCTARPPVQLAQPFEGRLGPEIAWFCRVADVLMAAGGPPVRSTYPVVHGLVPTCRHELRWVCARASHDGRAGALAGMECAAVGVRALLGQSRPPIQPAQPYDPPPPPRCTPGAAQLPAAYGSRAALVAKDQFHVPAPAAAGSSAAAPHQ